MNKLGSFARGVALHQPPLATSIGLATVCAKVLTVLVTTVVTVVLGSSLPVLPFPFRRKGCHAR